MKINDSELKRICFQETFYILYELKENTPIILNSLCVYTVKNDWIHSKVDFDIFTNVDDKRYISPRYNPKHCDCFLLVGERLAMCKTIEIKAEDYIDVMKIDGDFTFTVENSKFNEVKL